MFFSKASNCFGTLGDFASHGSTLCSTAGLTGATFLPAPGSRYYLVVPNNGSIEGSYGASDDGSARPAAVSACLPQQVGVCK